MCKSVLFLCLFVYDCLCVFVCVCVCVSVSVCVQASRCRPEFVPEELTSEELAVADLRGTLGYMSVSVNSSGGGGGGGAVYEVMTNTTSTILLETYAQPNTLNNNP